MTYREALQRAQWEAEQNRPWDWQDKLITGVSVCALIFLALLLIP